MITRPLISLCIVLIATGCIDRIDLPPGIATSRVVIDGFISAEPGPYSIRVSESLNIQSAYEVARPITLKYLVLSDNLGNTDSLIEHKTGSFFTHDDGIRGTPGRAYKINFETADGRVYESIFDTLYLSSGSVDSVHHTFVQRTGVDSDPTYGFDIHFDATDIELKGSLHMWRMVSTYQVETLPKFHRIQCDNHGPDAPVLVEQLPIEQQCPFPINCGCLLPEPCSGWTLEENKFVYNKPCVCCTCWVTIYNKVPIIPDQKLFDTRLSHVFADYIPLTYYNFMFKMHVQIDQFTLSHSAYLFYKAIVNQQSARGSLFQPITGKLPGNIVQVSGKPIPAEGIFFATSITSKSTFINRSDIPSFNYIPTIAPYPFANKVIINSCLEFPNSTTTKPLYWR
jgi:hypothetical protein